MGLAVYCKVVYIAHLISSKNATKIKLQEKTKISFSKILQNKWYHSKVQELVDSFSCCLSIILKISKRIVAWF